MIAAVRRLAAGIYPSVLAEAGLRGGLAALAEESPYPVRVLAVPARRLPAGTETAAYLLVSTAGPRRRGDGVDRRRRSEPHR